MTKMRQWSILTVVAVIIVFAAGWFLMVKPQKSKASDLRSQALTQQQSNAILQSQIDQLKSEEKNLPAQQAALRKFTTQVPDAASEPTIIRQLSAAANGAGVDLVSMTPGDATPLTSSTVTTPASGTTGTTGTTTPAAPPAQLIQLPISIGITGTYPNVESFFQSLENLPRALMVTGWSLCPETASGGSTSGGGAGSGTSANCTAPAVPQGKTLPPGALGGTLSAVVFYAPPAGTTTVSGTSLSPTTTTTTPTGTTPTTAASPATTGAPVAPTN